MSLKEDTEELDAFIEKFCCAAFEKWKDKQKPKGKTMKKTSSIAGLVRSVNRVRTERLIKSRMGRKIIGLSFCYGYDLVRDECTPKELVFRNENLTVRWS